MGPLTPTWALWVLYQYKKELTPPPFGVKSGLTPLTLTPLNDDGGADLGLSLL